MFGKLVDRLTNPGLDTLVLRLHHARTALFDLLEKEKSGKGLFGKGGDLKEQIAAARVEYAQAEAQCEKTKSEYSGLVALTNLLAVYIQAGRDASILEAAIAQSLGLQQENLVLPPVPPEKPVEKAEEKPADGPETDTFTVLEIRPGKSPGTIRAYCQAPDGAKHAVYAKNVAGQVLAGAVGRQVVVKYRQGDHGLIALAVQVA